MRYTCIIIKLVKVNTKSLKIGSIKATPIQGSLIGFTAGFSSECHSLGGLETTAAGLYHSHSNKGSEPQLTAVPYP